LVINSIKNDYNINSHFIKWQLKRKDTGIVSIFFIGLYGYLLYFKMKIEILKDRNRSEGILIKQGNFKVLLYLNKSWLKLQFNKTSSGWYFMLRFLGVGVNFYFR
jgi:hypothetical protein